MRNSEKSGRLDISKISAINFQAEFRDGQFSFGSSVCSSLIVLADISCSTPPLIHNMPIQKVFAREILDSRGNPTIEVDVHTEKVKK